MNEVSAPQAKYGIETCTMIVEFNSSVWTARKLDRNVSKEVTDAKSSNPDAARVNKNLMSGRTELAEIISHVGMVRNWVNSRTLPWSDNGQRALPVIQFMDFEAEVKKHEDKFWELVNAFIQIYPSLVTAQAMAMGAMFNRNDFPLPGELANKFAFSVNYLPMPTAGHFLIDIGNEAQTLLQEKLASLADERVERAMLEVKERLKEHLTRMSDRLILDKVDGELKPRKFHDTLVENGFELCDLIKGLNVVQDPDLEQARKRLEQVLSGVTPDALRKELDTRAVVKKEVDDILSKFKF